MNFDKQRGMFFRHQKEVDSAKHRLNKVSEVIVTLNFPVPLSGEASSNLN